MKPGFTAEEWFKDWDTQTLYEDLLKGVDKCSEESPIKGQKDGIVCGPILRLIHVDYENNVYLGSILIVTKNISDSTNPPVIEYVTGPTEALNEETSLNLNDGAFKPTLFHQDKLGEDTFQFYRYSVELPLLSKDQMIRYAVDGKWELNYRFYIPAMTTNFNVIAYSCNGFSLAVDTTKFKGSMWYDILQKHSKIHYNVMLGGGDQIYSDSIKLYSPKVAQWLETNNKVAKYTTKVDAPFRQDMENFYLKEYIEWYGFGHWHGSTENSQTTQRMLPLALATIPSINIWDDHDIIDGFGSYHDSFMKNDVFSSIGKAAYKYYMLFQHHVSIEEQDAYLNTKNWILGAAPGPYIGEKSHSVWTKLGPNMAVLGLDCRTERKLKQILSLDSYRLVFKRMKEEIEFNMNKPGQKIDHILVMLGVPIAYPRLVWLEWLFSSRLLAPIKYLSKKGIVGRGLLNEFNGDVELLDDLNDHWCARHHKAERNFLVAKLQDLGAQYGIRITILSGDVHLASLGRFRSKLHLHHPIPSQRTDEENIDILENPEYDSRLMFNVISSAVINTPPPDGMARLLQERNKLHHFDDQTDEDNIPLFKVETSGRQRRNYNAFLNKRNWSDILPVENVLTNPYLKDMLEVELNDKIVPGVIPKHCNKQLREELQKEELEKNKKENQAYPVTEKGVITSIHVETNAENLDSHTTWYYTPVPDLQTRGEKLSHSGMKHSIV